VASANCFGITGPGFVKSGEMPLGNDEHMSGRLWTDVFEGVNMVIFVNLPGGNFPGNDAAEKAVGIDHAVSPAVATEEQ